MAAVTVSNVEHVSDTRHVLLASLTNVQDGYTWATGFSVINAIAFTPTTAVAWGATVSGGTITFKVAAGTLAGLVRVEGI